MTKKLTEQQIKDIARANGVDYAVLRAIIDTECNGSGFLPDNTPTILFERHKYYEELQNIGFITISNEMKALRPDLCHNYATPRGGYGKGSDQPKRLDDAIMLIKKIRPDVDVETFHKVRECGLKATSWGLSQILASNYKAAGCESVQDFINAMYQSEAAQLEATVALLKSWGLETAMRNKDWRKIARKWNGPKYEKFGYHTKLARHYLRYS